jgi:hypothetical protein
MKNSFITIARTKSKGKQNVTHWDVAEDNDNDGDDDKI